MICQNISNLLGLECVPLNEEGTMAMLNTPFTFADGDPVPVFIQTIGDTVRVFDDGQVFMHFRGRGLQLESRRQAKFLIKSAERHGASYGEDWILQVHAQTNSASDAFRRYMSALHDICAWELDNEGAQEDAELVLEEVIMAFRALKPNTDISRDPGFKGISGKQRTLSLLVDGTGVAVMGTHHAAVSSALMTMVDIRQSPENQGRRFLFLIADKQDPERARQDAAILQAAAEVQLLSNLERQARGSPHSH